LRAEISLSSQAEVARRYRISPTQLNDILHARGGLSRTVLGKLRWELHKFYKRLGS
jgi:hypothetical protein